MIQQETEEDRLHRDEACLKLSKEGRRFFKFIEFDSNENLVTEIRKHPFGLFLIFATGALITVALLAVGAVGGFLDFGGSGTEGANSLKPVLVLISFVLLIGTLIMTYIGAFLYTSNVIFVTSEKIAQVLYISLFNRKVSQLSIGDVQDVTVTQNGVMAHIFNYGTLVIESAGEQENYKFTYVPEPYEVSKLIVGAHERNLVQYGN